MKFYDKGFYKEALHELNKVLLIDPENQIARGYINRIQGVVPQTRMDMVTAALDQAEGKSSGERDLSRDILTGRELSEFERGRQFIKDKKSAAVDQELSRYVDIRGEYQVSMGVRSPAEVIWKEANADLNERNFRIVFGEKKYNTFDPAVFDRFRLNMDTKNLDELGVRNLNAHLNLTVDPWSFTGKSDTFTLNGAGGDRAEFELKYWSNTGRTINEIVNTRTNGDAMALPEIKVVDGHTTPTSVTTTFSNTFSIPSLKINREFMPVREFWLDYKDDAYSLRVFPIAYQDQALTSDDPLNISNRHSWWEESPWLADWKPGNLNTGATPNDFAKGIWDDSLAFFTRDSDGLRLTALRGFSFGFDGVDMKIRSTLASPKNLWADYGDFHTYATATRAKFDLGYNFGIGVTHAGHFGYKEGALDGLNNVLSLDTGFEPIMGTKLQGQVAASQSTYDRTESVFKSKKKGNAYLVSLINRFPVDDLHEQDYFSIRKKDGEDGYLKSRLQAVRMDKNFESTLASYSQTRDDEFWSRHLSFRKHPLYLYTGLSKPMKFDDIAPFAIGDGVDSGRNVVSWRLEGATKFFDRDLDGLLDVRNVHRVNGAFIENVSRLELQHKSTDKLTLKFFGLHHGLPKTTAGFDPFIFSEDTGNYLVNTAITGGKDPSLRTVSFGLNYDANEKFSWNFVYEHTNDATVATDNYPRGLFNSSSFTTYMENGLTYREPIPFLYSQTGFDLPPYDDFDIFKLGFSFRPIKELEFYLDCAFNENKKAGQIDDNMNHFGLEVAYAPNYKLSLLFKYTLSRWLDMLMLNSSGEQIFNWHSNFFFETRYNINQDSEFVMEYGVGGITPLGSTTYDPFGGALAVLDTQHILRLYYKKRF